MMSKERFDYRTGCSLTHSIVGFTWLFLSQENLQQWLLDERGRDQFVIRFGSDTEVYWNDARIGKPDPCYQRGVRGVVNIESVQCRLGAGWEGGQEGTSF